MERDRRSRGVQSSGSRRVPKDILSLPEVTSKV